MRRNALPMRILALGIALVMLCTACGDSAKASAMRLMRTKGSVGIQNGEGERLSLEEDMRLYSGYCLSTRRRSFAWINLDSVKLTKMDASSEIEIRKSGKDLEIIVNKGRLYFNVTRPLDKDEDLDIRTSTMSVGIRGTCGWVEADEEEGAKVYILEGAVECFATGPDGGQTDSVAVSAGQAAKLSPSAAKIQVEPFQEKDVLPFVLEELAGDEALREKIREDSGLDIKDLPDGGTPEDPAAQAMDEFWRALEDMEKGSLEDKVRDAVKETAFSDQTAAIGGAGEGLLDSQEMLVEAMLEGQTGVRKPDWLQSLTDAFSSENPENSLADGSEATDYMQIRMGRNVNCYKPNIYLYGEAGTTMELIFSAPMLLTETIPDYSAGWTVEIGEDENLVVDGKAGYSYLFYESVTIPGIFQTREGFFVGAWDRRERFEEILRAYGLNRREIEDFVEFWDEFLQEGTDYLMYPQTTETVDGAMPLEVRGAQPDNYFRLWFCFREAEGSFPMPAEPEIVPAGHEGTALVEWGGMIF